MSRRFINLQGQSFIEPAAGQWYNLETGRTVRIPRHTAPFITINDPRVTGHSATVDRFLTMNTLPSRPVVDTSSRLLPVTSPVRLLPRSPMPIQVTSPQRPQPLSPLPPVILSRPSVYGRPLPTPPIPPRQPIGPYQGGLCSVGGSGTYHLRTSDVADIPDEIIQSLCNFTLINLRVKAKVVYVVDGDTVDLAFFLPFQHLTRSHLVGRGLNKRPMQPALTYRPDPDNRLFTNGERSDPKGERSDGMVVRYRCRLNGIDAAEKETQQGQLAKRLMTEKFQSLGNTIYIIGSTMDLYGRLLVDLFEDAQYQRNFTRYLLNVNDPVLGRIAEPYEGGTKSQYMKNLPVIQRQ